MNSPTRLALCRSPGLTSWVIQFFIYDLTALTPKLRAQPPGQYALCFVDKSGDDFACRWQVVD